MIEANCAIFINEEKILALQRAPTRRFNPNKWGFMNGDIQEGKSPEEILIKDALDKLHLHVDTITECGEILIDKNVTEPIQRHVFFCTADFDNLHIDKAKYITYGWFSKREFTKLDLEPGALTILNYVSGLPNQPALIE
jgi:8-oxo-dGTP pyrophosphatase MutT (NUDIX family)